jgi:hypothetical protein
LEEAVATAAREVPEAPVVQVEEAAAPNLLITRVIKPADREETVEVEAPAAVAPAPPVVTVALLSALLS